MGRPSINHIFIQSINHKFCSCLPFLVVAWFLNSWTPLSFSMFWKCQYYRYFYFIGEGMFICKQSSRNQKFSKGVPWASSFSITWQLTENVNSQTPTQTYCISHPREKNQPSVFHKSSRGFWWTLKWFSVGGQLAPLPPGHFTASGDILVVQHLGERL